MMGIGLRNTVFGWVLDDEQGANDRRVKLASFISGTAVDCTRRRSGDGIFTCERGVFARRLD
jgi:hypothetical protein